MTSDDEADDARFLQVSNDDTNQFIDEMEKLLTPKNKNKTKQKVNWKYYQSVYMGTISWGHTCSGTSTWPDLYVRSQNNEEYDPDNLNSIQSSVSRYLMKENGMNILQDKDIYSPFFS